MLGKNRVMMADWSNRIEKSLVVYVCICVCVCVCVDALFVLFQKEDNTTEIIREKVSRCFFFDSEMRGLRTTKETSQRYQQHPGKQNDAKSQGKMERKRTSRLDSRSWSTRHPREPMVEIEPVMSHIFRMAQDKQENEQARFQLHYTR